MTNTENDTAVRKDILAGLAQASAVGDETPEELLNAYRLAVLNEAIEAARGEYLHDDTTTPEDEAYNQAVSDVVAAIGALLEDGK
ncbi:hypothetical protein QFZ63_001490 [Streptomyces sp. B3I7]|uniref:hypothetical protein n=1 Tax=Streptomyces sp. B3I7 TaxID=3042269 RepID=UPI00277E6B65|nr:hypothetical protein [Streptomyces sp. B3I7]MDQ0809776.1 hypothetical protein [Streptomyces sp. B3I7]